MIGRLVASSAGSPLVGLPNFIAGFPASFPYPPGKPGTRYPAAGRITPSGSVYVKVYWLVAFSIRRPPEILALEPVQPVDKENTEALVLVLERFKAMVWLKIFMF